MSLAKNRNGKDCLKFIFRFRMPPIEIENNRCKVQLPRTYLRRLCVKKHKLDVKISHKADIRDFIEFPLQSGNGLLLGINTVPFIIIKYKA